VPALPWRALLVGPPHGGIAAVRPAEIDSADPTVPVVLLAPSLTDEQRAACRSRWPASWVVDLGPPAPTMAADLALAGLEPAGVGAMVFGADGQLHGTTRALRAELGIGGVLADVEPHRLIAPRTGPANLARTEGGTRPLPLHAWWMGSDGAGCFVVALRPPSTASGLHPALLANARELVTVIDARGIVRYQSPGSLAALGLAPAALLGNPLAALFAEDRVAVADALDAVLDTPAGLERVAWRARHADGSVRWLESTLCNQLDNPAVGGIVVNSRDITEQRLLEDSQQEQERLRVASLLASTVAHDLNNMLSVMALHLDEVGVLVGDDATATARVDAVQGTITRASELARRLLAFGRKKDEGVRRVDLGDLVRQLAPVIEPVVHKGQQLIVEIDEGSHPVAIDPARLEQAIVNLVVNARDAMGEAGTVAVRVQRRPGGDWPHVAVLVEDDGPGMAPELLDRVFEPYFTTKGPERGSGLGLVVVRKLARDAGGRVEVRSTVGQGTSFEVLLPIDLDPQSAAERTIP